MQKQEKQLKKLPNSVSKGEIKEMYRGHSSRNKIKRAFQECMHNFNDRILTNKEFCLLLEILGTPPGYCNHFKEGDTWLDRLTTIIKIEKLRS